MIVSEQIIQVIDALCKKFGIAVNWTNENVIPYIQTLCDKLVNYEIATSAAWIVMMVLLSIGSAILVKKFAPQSKEGLSYYDNEGRIIATVFSVIGVVGLNIATVCVVIKQVADIIKCVTFHEMYVFEYVSALMK